MSGTLARAWTRQELWPKVARFKCRQPHGGLSHEWSWPWASNKLCHNPAPPGKARWRQEWNPERQGGMTLPLPLSGPPVPVHFTIFFLVRITVWPATNQGHRSFGTDIHTLSQLWFNCSTFANKTAAKCRKAKSQWACGLRWDGVRVEHGQCTRIWVGALQRSCQALLSSIHFPTDNHRKMTNDYKLEWLMSLLCFIPPVASPHQRLPSTHWEVGLLDLEVQSRSPCRNTAKAQSERRECRPFCTTKKRAVVWSVLGCRGAHMGVQVDPATDALAHGECTLQHKRRLTLPEVAPPTCWRLIGKTLDTLRSLFDTPDLTVVKGGILWQKPMKQHRQTPAVGWPQLSLCWEGSVCWLKHHCQQNWLLWQQHWWQAHIFVQSCSFTDPKSEEKNRGKKNMQLQRDVLHMVCFVLNWGWKVAMQTCANWIMLGSDDTINKACLCSADQAHWRQLQWSALKAAAKRQLIGCHCDCSCVNDQDKFFAAGLLSCLSFRFLNTGKNVCWNFFLNAGGAQATMHRQSLNFIDKVVFFAASVLHGCSESSHRDCCRFFGIVESAAWRGQEHLLNHWRDRHTFLDQWLKHNITFRWHDQKRLTCCLTMLPRKEKIV